MDKVSGSPEPTPNLFWRVDLMTMIRTTGLLTGAMTLALTGIAGAADNDNASIDALRAELNELRAQNNSLSARVDAQDTEWLNEERASDIRGIVQDVLADSQSRTSLQDSGMMAGYKAGKGFFLSNADGSFSLMINGELQTRFVLNNNPGSEPGVSETDWGFQVRRAKVRFQGNVIDPSWTYQINGSFEGPDTAGPRALGVDLADGAGGTFNGAGVTGVGTPSNGGTFEFQEAFIAKELDNGITLTFGQFKTPWMREELVESSNQLAVERSVVNEIFNQDRAVGIMASWNNDDFNIAASYNNGQATAVYQNTRYTNFSDNPTEWAFSARGEWKLSGDWSDFDTFTSSPGDEQAIMLGAAFMGQKYGDNSTAATFAGISAGNFAGLPNGAWDGTLNLDGTTVWGVTVDVSAKFGGFSFFAAGVWQNFDPGVGVFVSNGTVNGVLDGSGDSYDPWGFVVQGGYSLTDQWEIFARYEEGNASDDNFSGLPVYEDGGNPSIVTIGANYFINENVKFTVDWGINFADNMNLGSYSPSMTGWESSDDSDQWLVRAQVQLTF